MNREDLLILSFFWFIVIVLIIIMVLLIIKISSPKKNEKSEDLIQEHLFNLTKVFESKISETNFLIDKKIWENFKIMQENFSKNFDTTSQISQNSNKTIEEITKKLTNLEETNKQIKDIWWQLEWLESILKNPKQRWILWEYFLENILKNILAPENYRLQYSFKNWEIVDAIVFLDKKIIPIDSKFSLENYNKILEAKTPIEKEIAEKNFRNDLKKRIDETSKYIKPNEKTMDFAFMFIPSEAIYYDLLVNKIWTLKNSSSDLIEYAFKEKKVIIISPTSFYAYLQTVMQWLRALEIEKKAEEIKKHIEKLSFHLKNYEEYFNKVWNNLWTTINNYNLAWNEFKKIDKDIVKISSWNFWWDIDVKKIENIKK